jgi:ElaB/YqjD/DUF883 family membrane-anchored ribosome-binding protein
MALLEIHATGMNKRKAYPLRSEYRRTGSQRGENSFRLAPETRNQRQAGALNGDRKRSPTMVEKKLSAVPNEAVAEIEASAARVDLDNQIAELRAEIARLTESVSAIGNGAKAVVASEAEVLTERLRERIREEPVSTLLAIAGVSFVIGLLARR